MAIFKKAFPRGLRAEDVFAISVILFAFTIPFPRSINAPATYLVVLTFLFTQKTSTRTVWEKRALIIQLVYILVLVVSVLYSENIKNAFFQLEKRIVLVLFPLVFFFKSPQKSDLQKHVIAAFSLGVVLISLAALALSGHELIHSAGMPGASVGGQALFDSFTYDRLCSHVKLHPTYFSIFVLFALFGAFHQEKKNWPVILFLTVMMLLISSRMGVILLFVLLAIILFKNRKSHSRKQYAIAGAGIVVLFFLMILAFPAFVMRHVNDYTALGKHSNNTGVNMRLVHWRAALDVMQDNFTLGVGLGDAQIAMDTAYKRMGRENFYGYGPHNQYFLDTIHAGLVCVLALVTVIIICTYIGMLRKNYLHLCMLTLITIFSLTEATLSINKGIVFFAFFNSFFLFHYKPPSDENALRP